jgi:HEAT repeat protein
LSNDQGEPGSRKKKQLKPGESLEMPAMVESQAVGSYVIHIRGGKTAKVTIKDDIEVAQKWDEELLAKIRKGDPFADHVAYLILTEKQARPEFIDGLLQVLASDNQAEAERAACTLSRVPELPPRAGAMITQAMRKQLAMVQKQGSSKSSLLASLAAMAGQIGTEDALEAVLSLAQTKEVRGQAVWALGFFKQGKALSELRLFLTDQDEQFQFRAAQRLAERKDPEALKVLLTVAHDPKSRWRMYSFESLLKYADDQRVEPAIKTGLNDADSQVRQSAEFALRQLANQKKPKP